MDWKFHPYMVAKEIIRRYGTELAFEFSRYRYTPLSIKDEREAFWVPATDLTSSTVERLIEELAADQDLSFHSRVVGRGRGLNHIPMIDFHGAFTPEKAAVIDQVMPVELSSELLIFQTGKSYHGYVPLLISEAEWQVFCGSLLLMNIPNHDAVTDVRWIGHRLRAGYAALRWSCNSNGYSILPRRLGRFSDILAGKG